MEIEALISICTFTLRRLVFVLLCLLSLLRFRIIKQEYKMEEAIVFPNECYICKSTGELIRCQCNLISYCGDEHQRQHWLVHEDFCNAIMLMLEEKGLNHIYEELFDVFDIDFNKKRVEISQELIMKLKRPMSLLEQAMFLRPRVCYVCCKVEQEELTNCPRCPVASFCKLHQNDETHKDNCEPMRNYLDFLRISDKLNIDVDFVTRKFGNVFEDLHTFTLKMDAEEHVDSRVMKIDVHDFISSASKLHRAIHIIYGTVPSEIVIHINALYFERVLLKENYWEFLLHYNPRIRMLNIVFIDWPYESFFDTSLCYNCRSLKKTLQIEFFSSFPYNYVLKKCDREPDVVYSEIGEFREDSDKWIEIGCLVILKFDSKIMFDNKLSFLERSTDVYKIIYQGPISTEFCNKNDHFLIFKKRDHLNRHQNYKIIQQTMNEYVLLPPLPCPPASNAKSEKVETKISGTKDDESSKTRDDFNGVKIKENESLIMSREVDAEKIEKEYQGTICENFDSKNQSFLLKHNLFLINENARLREHLNCSVKEILELQNKISQLQNICFNSVKKK